MFSGTVTAPAENALPVPSLVILIVCEDTDNVKPPPGPVTVPSVAPATLNPVGKVIAMTPVAGRLVTVVNATVCVDVTPA